MTAPDLSKWAWRALLADYPLAILSGTAAFLWGLWLLNPAWQSFAQFRNLAMLEVIAPEEVWGTVISVSGLLLLLGVFCKWRRVALVGCASVFGFRLFVLILIGKATNWQTASVPDFTIWTIMAGWAFLFLSVVHWPTRE